MSFTVNEIKDRLFSISSEKDFSELALDVFRFQAQHVKVYRDFLSLLNVEPNKVSCVEDIPFLPISFFKSHQVLADNKEVELVFESSGTTGQIRSRHHVHSKQLYVSVFLEAFKLLVGDLDGLRILALLPSYLERKGSSLVLMVDELIKRSNNPSSGFYLHNTNELIEELERSDEKTLLIGVSFALLDLAEQNPKALQNVILMETGGMKGRRKELIRAELHKLLNDAFSLNGVSSEYGMTELLSQAYSIGGERFQCPPWMKVMVRDTHDPMTAQKDGKTGGLNVIDLANVYSCSFIATQDLGRSHANSFEVLGRFDNSDIRGCNLMVIE